MYQRYLADPASVDAAWHDFFADYKPADRWPAARRRRRRHERGRRGAERRDAGARRRHGRRRPAGAPADRSAATPRHDRIEPTAAKPRPAEPTRPRRDGRRPQRRPTAPLRPRPRRRRRRQGRANRGAGQGGDRPGSARARCAASPPDRAEHGRLADRADRDQRARGAGEAARRQPHRDQQPPRPRSRRQGQLHPPDRVRAGPGARRAPGDEQLVRRGRRQAGAGPPGARQPRHRDRPGQAGRLAQPRGAVHQGLRADGLPAVLAGVRGRGPPGPPQRADHGRLRRHDDLADQPGRHRHGALAAAADGRPGHDHRRRRDGVPGAVRRDERGAARRAGGQQDHHADSAPTTTGSSRARSPASSSRSCTSCCSASTASTTRSSPRCGSRTSRCAGCATSSLDSEGQINKTARVHRADPRVPGARSPDGRHRPAGVQHPQAPGPGRARARPDAVGPGPRRSRSAASPASRR